MEDSPRGHRHDGCSPLPLGMDASPAPTRWTGANTIWPHDPRTGWSYCVMINSWVSVPDSGTASADVSNHASKVTYFRVLVGLQSPDGVSTLHGILRRFSHFMKLYDSLKCMFPKKKLPVPPKKSFRQINHNKNYLQQRRLALSDWMVKLLADLDISRSPPIASFLELEEAAKVAKPDIDKIQLQNWLREGSERHEIQTLHSEIDTVEAEDSVAPADSVSVQEGVSEISTSNVPLSGRPGVWHVQGHLIDSDAASETSFVSGSELSCSVIGDGRDQASEGVSSFDGEILKAVQALLPIDHRGNVRRVLTSLQSRVSRARTDMEDLVARINHEVAVKDFLTMKVKDVEMELDKVRRTSLENLQQAVSIEREGYMTLQWELEDCKVALAKALEEARTAQESKARTEQELQAVESENKRVQRRLTETNEKLELLQADRDNFKAKALAEVKVLAKEVKALRKTQPELKQKLEAAQRSNTELEAQIERQKKEKEKRTKLLLDVGALRERLQQCTVDFLAKEDAGENDKNAAVADAADLLSTSDSRIGLLIAEAQLLAEEVGDDDKEKLGSKEAHLEGDTFRESQSHIDETCSISEDGINALRRFLMDIFVDNAHLHKLVNSLTLKALLAESKHDKVQSKEAMPRKSMLHRFL
ncbi:hypothetical protein KP509_23G069700 [Ceratopteris richardii]|uniref:PX domain-containing protein n=1 Tax=Ceratopteris richardii TaxID=49495 RepID=A0A8T2S0V7_CERRI|nr:hypothetical protein KP509_23G069700 [Ceratopteris richardii]